MGHTRTILSQAIILLLICLVTKVSGFATEQVPVLKKRILRRWEAADFQFKPTLVANLFGKTATYCEYGFIAPEQDKDVKGHGVFRIYDPSIDDYRCAPLCQWNLVLSPLVVGGFLGIASLDRANGAGGPCGASSPDSEVMKLIPCADAAQDSKAVPSASCCAQVKILGQSPSCLCAVMLSDTAKSSGVKPEIAITIPKRCNLANRPVGYKCGGKTKVVLEITPF
ncbi:Bifunctional inhibitor/plant lipid transfer protein/seed storage helical domain [Dillenia turbinata]|uniref:Bifunctional inhibitor/plant lipid transfer protein/seed storage helical domain n=1 Tax=Dillenia turbinata TaxID=194707 RepID=A0AAN8W5D3_9MAGN